MSKVLKRLLLILIVIVGAMFVLPKSEQATISESFEISDSTTIYGVTPNRLSDYSDPRITRTLGKLKNGDYLYVVNPYVVNNNFVFCIEANKHLTDGEFKINSTITINNDSSNFLKGLAYILANSSTGFNSSSEEAYKTDTVQVAVWTYLYEHSSEAQSILGVSGSDSAPGIYEKTTASDALVKIADEIYNGTMDIIVSGTIYKMVNVDSSYSYQQLLIVEAIIIKENEGFDLTLNKIDSETRNQISGAKFDVTMTGVKSVNVNGKSVYGTGTNYEIKLTNQTIGEITYKNIKPITNDGTVKIIVKEIEEPEGYELDTTEYRMEFKYDSSTGKWTYSNGNIGVSGDDWITSSGGNTFEGTFTFNVKNEPTTPGNPNDLIIKFNKVDVNGNLITSNSATFEVTAVSGVTGIKVGDIYNTVNGVATISKFSLTASSGAIKFKESNPPMGYSGLTNEFSIFITKTNDGYEFRKLDALGRPIEIIGKDSKLGDGVTVAEIQGGTLTLNIENEEKSALTLELYKQLDSDYQVAKGDGLKIKYEIKGARSIKGKNDDDEMVIVESNGTVEVGSPFILEMELNPSSNNKIITIIIQEINPPLGYEAHKTEYKLTCTYLGDGKGWTVEKTTNGADDDFLECPNGKIGNILKITLTNIPQDCELEPIITEGNITGKVWLKEQEGDKDIDANKSTSNKYEKNDTLFEGVDVYLDELIIAEYKPVYALRFYYRHDNGNVEAHPPENGQVAYPEWISNWSSKQLKYLEIPENEDPSDYWEKYKEQNTAKGPLNNSLDEFTNPKLVIIRYEETDPIKLENIYIGKTDSNGGYNYLFSLTTYKWKYQGVEHQISQYVKSGKVSFKYDGVTYITTTSKNSYDVWFNQTPKAPYYSNVSEVNREAFNNKFKTVNLDNTTATNAYDDFKNTYGYIGESEISIPANGVKNGDAAYQMSAGSSWGQVGAATDNPETRRPITITVNMGLLTREIDVSASTQVDSAIMTINEKTTTYTYNDILEGNLTNINLNDVNKGNNETTIPVDVYPTDYYYRIEDYKGADIELPSGKIEDRDKSLNMSETANLAKNDKSDEDELEVYVTYKVRLFAATAGKKVRINQIAYYFDQNYSLVSIRDNENKGYSAYELDSRLSKIDGMTGVMVNGSWDISSKEQYLYFTFKVNKYNDAMYVGNINGNIVTITSYSTEEGLLDIDSAIRNLRNSGKDTNLITRLEEIQFEDDTAMAEKIEIVITKETRTISGNAFNDANVNGVLDDTNINDVIVQLIEITENNNEYIWQETRTGSNKVTTLVANQENNNIGTEFEGMRTYTNSVNSIGQYEFKDIVPGNYIVRFIYGDGYNYDITANNTTYNGVDFKSTIDSNYNKEWYNEVITSYARNASVARDNEARRLEVISATTEIDARLGVALDVYANNKQLNSLTEAEKDNILQYLITLKSQNDNELNAALYSIYKNDYNKIEFNELDENRLLVLKKCIAYKTFMVAETSKINVPIDAPKDDTNIKTSESSTKIQCIGYIYNKIEINFNNVNFGVMKKPEVKLELEKHITGLKITPTGTGMSSIVDASADIQDIMNGNIVNTTGETTGLSTIKSTRDNRGFWEVVTDTEELKNGANLEVEYTYVVTNVGDEDYISSALLDLYESNQSEYGNILKKTANELKSNIKGRTYTYGSILGEYYYTGIKGDTDKAVTSRVEQIGEALNNNLRYEKSKTNGYVNSDFDKLEAEVEERYKNIYDVEGNLIKEDRDTVIKTTSPSSFLAIEAIDMSKKLKLETVLSSLDVDSKGNIPSYIAEITRYSSASGGRNLDAIPGNLNYVHSKDTRITVEKYNEEDEFWGEAIIITKPTGENKILAVQIGVTVAISVAVIGAGIVLIRKFVLNKIV